MKFIHSYLFVVLTSLSFGLFGQTTVTVGTGTSTDYNFPIQPYFNYGWTSQIYTSAEIGTSGVLNSIAFYINNSSGSYTLDNQKIYMRQTSASQHVDKYYPGTTGFTLVYSGSITFGTSGWKTINLSSPFAYNGTSNLEVLIESRDGSTFTSALQTRYTSKSEYRTKYDYNDYNFPTTWYAGGRVTKLPNIQFVINTCSVVAGTVSTTTPSICSGGSASLTLSGQTSGQTIQWQTSTDNTTFSDIAGANAATYTTPALTTASYYRAKVGSGSCIVTSSSQSIAILSLPTAPTVGSNSPVCVGSSLNLTASTIAGASYAWTGPNGFTSSLQNPVVNTQADTIHRGAYTLVISLNGCSSSAQTTAVVNTYPSTLAVTASNLRIQAGESTTLTASGVTNYTWDSNLGTGSVKVVSPTQTTTYTISGDNGNACVAQEAITIDVVNPTNTGVNSETVSIGTGTATDYNVPIQTYFNYGWSSQLYLASEIRGAGYLNSLSFYTVNSGSTYTLENQKVYVRHTQESSFADKYYPTTTGFTLVYEGPVTITSSGWLTIPFSSAFNYNGTSNLEVLVESRDGSTFTSAIQTRYTNQSGTYIYRTKFDYNNNEFPTNYNQGGRLHHYANIQFNKTVCNLPSLTLTSNSPVCAGGVLQLSADTIQGATYTWTGPNGFSSNLQNPIVTTNSSVSLHSGNYQLLVKVGSCERTFNINVSINSSPEFRRIYALNQSVCTNDFIYLYSDSLALTDSILWQSSIDGIHFETISASLRNELIDSMLTQTRFYKLINNKNQCSTSSNIIKINVDCNSKFTTNTQNRSFLVDISSILGKTAPYIYQISETPIPPLKDQYDLLHNDTIIDSLSFYANGINSETYLFHFDGTPKYITVFDKTGKRIYDTYIPAQTKELYVSTGIRQISNLNLVTSSIGKGLFGNILEQNKVYRYQLNSISKLNYFGFFNDLTYETAPQLSYGIEGTSSGINIVHNGIQTPYSIDISKPALFEIYPHQDKIDYVLNGHLVYSGDYTPVADVVYLDAFSLDQYGVFFEYDTPFSVPGWAFEEPFTPYEVPTRFSPPYKPQTSYSYSNKITVLHNKCFNNLGTVTFDFNPNNYPYNFIKIEKIEVRNSQSVLITTIYKNGGYKYSFPELPVGNYTYKITYSYRFSTIKIEDKGTFTVDSYLTWVKTRYTQITSDEIYGKNATDINLGFGETKNLTLTDENFYYIDFNINEAQLYSYRLDDAQFQLRWKSKTNNSVVLPSTVGLKIKREKFFYNFPEFPTPDDIYWGPPVPFNFEYTNYILSFGGKDIVVNATDRFRYAFDKINRKIQLFRSINSTLQLEHEIGFNSTNEQFILEYTTPSSLFGIRNATSNLACSFPPSFVKLVRDLQGENFIPVDNQIGFIYEEEYTVTDKLKYRLLNSKLEEVYNSNTLELKSEYGDNRFIFNTSALAIGSYYLEVKNNKGENFYLRFTK